MQKQLGSYKALARTIDTIVLKRLKKVPVLSSGTAKASGGSAPIAPPGPEPAQGMVIALGASGTDYGDGYVSLEEGTGITLASSGGTGTLGSPATITITASGSGIATLAVTNIDDPSTELGGEVGSAEGEVLIVYQADIGKPRLYTWTAVAITPATPWFCADSATGTWVQHGGYRQVDGPHPTVPDAPIASHHFAAWIGAGAGGRVLEDSGVAIGDLMTALPVLAVSDIDNPAAGLATINGTAEASLLVVYDNAADAIGRTRIYSWTATAITPAAPFFCASLTPGTWIQVGSYRQMDGPHPTAPDAPVAGDHLAAFSGSAVGARVIQDSGVAIGDIITEVILPTLAVANIDTPAAGLATIDGSEEGALLVVYDDTTTNTGRTRLYSWTATAITPVSPFFCASLTPGTWMQVGGYRGTDGPASAPTDGDRVVFDGVTGRLLKALAIAAAEINDLALALTQNIKFTAPTIIPLTMPASSSAIFRSNTRIGTPTLNYGGTIIWQYVQMTHNTSGSFADIAYFPIPAEAHTVNGRLRTGLGANVLAAKTVSTGGGTKSISSIGLYLRSGTASSRVAAMPLIVEDTTGWLAGAASATPTSITAAWADTQITGEGTLYLGIKFNNTASGNSTYQIGVGSDQTQVSVNTVN